MHFSRLKGIFFTAGGFTLFLFGAVTDHWVESGPIHYGLWGICKDLIPQNDSNQMNVSSTLSSTMSTTPFLQDHTGEEIEETDNEEACELFSLTEISAEFHVIRALTAFATALFFSMTACGKLLRCKHVTKDSFLETHRAELVCLLGASSGLVAIIVFKSSFRSFEFNDHYEPTSGWSPILVEIGCIFICLGVCLMMAKTVTERFAGRIRGQVCCHSVPVDDFKNNPIGACYRCLTCRQSQTPQPVERDTEAEEASLHSNFVPPLYDYFVSENEADSETDLNIITVRNAPILDPNSSCSEPAPRYEDLSPRETEGLPPPPSYAEAISRQYNYRPTQL